MQKHVEVVARLNDEGGSQQETEEFDNVNGVTEDCQVFSLGPQTQAVL
jgi:hypothetical protein